MREDLNLTSLMDYLFTRDINCKKKKKNYDAKIKIFFFIDQ